MMSHFKQDIPANKICWMSIGAIFCVNIRLILEKILRKSTFLESSSKIRLQYWLNIGNNIATIFIECPHYVEAIITEY